ncbi:UDP-N-acetylmuramoyl-tripeptide--D-alanyl-D-alanine ligase [Halobacillus locisalis]|uniref:UDP-N-acetylmuramoyl-tripeptide--D-alanyl-D-alanine ligase n=1 Tax=Halobacillus locisalis TaxID=220753 RepID=A0A838CQC4_9BACI|nr:UDP-N-acetylmuramoyl-tripeptide--D-alanyl-D-alanine ligase [Halobacillus locisalis]MBA2174267.1 UDP-N-acetylmuramoyl-tripeptide--D-alanyl-D-alanine ligase [Halobacillus locisalis]
MKLDVFELTTIFPNYKGAAEDKITLRSIMTDTRKKAKQSLFIPIIGQSFDAHAFIGEAIRQGATAALWQKDKELPSLVPTDFPVFFVEDTTKALQDLAHFYLRKINPIVVGVTGSNGKTTTKDMVAAVLNKKYRTHKTQGNFNNHIGLPLTVLSMDTKTEALVLEMGMDHAGEISVLSRLAEPGYAIITNIGESHIENLGSREAIAAAKLEITEGLDGSCIIDGDEPLLQKAKEKEYSISCGFGESCAYVAVVQQLTDEETVFKVNGELYKLPMAGRHNVKNASYVIALAQKLGLTKEQIQQGFLEIEVSGMRFEKHTGKEGALIINDAYNASPTSMKAVIEIIRHLTSKSKKVLVLGDMFELGEHSEQLHASVAEAINEDIDVIYTIGEHSRAISDAVKAKALGIETKHFTEKESLSHQIQSILTEETVVLIKASRGMKLEELLDELVN